MTEHLDLPELSGLRRSYTSGVLEEADAPDEPFALFDAWLAQARESPLVPEANAVVVSTVDADGTPSSRHVLVKDVDPVRGFAFYTGLGSRKSLALGVHPRAALLFPWSALERQVHVTGRVSGVDRATAGAYFDSRPWASRIGAWASEQSSVVASRQVLEDRFAAYAQRWPEGSEVPVPDRWGGWWVAAETVELWQGRTGRLHDRLRYRRAGDGWLRERLAP